MSLYKVPLTRILSIDPHPNPEVHSLEIATVYGFNVVTRKGTYKVGDLCLYIPVDSILPQDVENVLFPPDAKIKLEKHRVRQIRIQKVASQGMLVSPDLFADKLGELTLEDDYAEKLGITKYEPPTNEKENSAAGANGKAKPKKGNHPLFTKYGGLDNIKWFPALFTEGELVVVEEKIHGSHVRGGWAPTIADTLWKKVKKFFNLLPEWEWVYGSNNVQLQSKNVAHKGYYGEDIYGKVLEKYEVHKWLPKGYIIHGEVYGHGIQNNYNYGTLPGEHKLAIFDVKFLTETNGVKHYEYMDVVERDLFLHRVGKYDLLPPRPEGPSVIEFNKDRVHQWTFGSSLLCSSQKVREGVVVRSVDHSKGRRVLKWISEDYLNDKSNTDFH